MHCAKTSKPSRRQQCTSSQLKGKLSSPHYCFTVEFGAIFSLVKISRSKAVPYFLEIHVSFTYVKQYLERYQILRVLNFAIFDHFCKVMYQRKVLQTKNREIKYLQN